MAEVFLLLNDMELDARDEEVAAEVEQVGGCHDGDAHGRRGEGLLVRFRLRHSTISWESTISWWPGTGRVIIGIPM